MAEADSAQFSLLTLEEELTCSICLSTFVNPVTTPCGHNFCQECLLETWKDSYCCPQCRTDFATKPELKKNTVLCTVVDTFNQRANKEEDKVEKMEVEKMEVEKMEGILCDTCMQEEAVKTCLTCMASFCEQHLRPHQVNPIYSVHQLKEPIADLKERICSQHHKLMELFCSQHLQPICSQCLQSQHRGCSFTSPEEQRSLKESDLRTKLTFLDGKISQTETVLAEMRDKQNRLKDSATNRKKIISGEYQQIRDMLSREEHDALNVVEREMESGQSKFKNLAKKFNENINNMSSAKEEIHSLLSASNTMAFLQASVDIPQAASFDPFAPRINLDSKKVIVSNTFAVSLKEHLVEIFKQPLEARLPITKPGSDSKPPSYLSHQASEPLPLSTRQGSSPSSKSGAKKKPAEHIKKYGKSLDGGTECTTKSMDNLLEFLSQVEVGGASAATQLQEKQPEHLDGHLNMSNSVKRSDLLKFATVLTLDHKTAHKRIMLTDGFTKALVSDEHMNYPDHPKRFAVCSQVLAYKGFSTGRHYWEVRLSSNNFIGIGLAYGSIDRKGPTSRLGRNAQSWCVEWFNVKLSAWHNNSETVLANPSPKRVGVLLDCKEGTATFYSVADRAYAFHTFVFPFVEAVYPAFWIFSSGSSISLCKLQA
ncbi:E3 ubiquitin/ISG15 ligase TRIM25-like [Gouania willdenowi]|uniref:RING-type E3 ubiquitin transferase n=1 Tax=Gouania willdenowi TaxID=441366 RepID=A0A8C5GKK1_GOUWI|nr:E3 ubiquitin/ISG15 ligase TRIM25 [Gouania willdenowi]XP_028313352.1 E3 ubiquitin/ISG15 ligase TRIM25 [Gouania willdenowi]